MQGLDSQLLMRPRFIAHFKRNCCKLNFLNCPLIFTLYGGLHNRQCQLKKKRIKCLQTKQVHCESRFQAHPHNSENKPEQATASLCEGRLATYATGLGLSYVYDFNTSANKWPFFNTWKKVTFCQQKVALHRGVSRKVWMVQWGVAMCEAGCLARFRPFK